MSGEDNHQMWPRRRRRKIAIIKETAINHIDNYPRPKMEFETDAGVRFLPATAPAMLWEVQAMLHDVPPIEENRLEL